MVSIFHNDWGDVGSLKSAPFTQWGPLVHHARKHTSIPFRNASCIILCDNVWGPGFAGDANRTYLKSCIQWAPISIEVTITTRGIIVPGLEPGICPRHHLISTSILNYKRCLRDYEDVEEVYLCNRAILCESSRRLEECSVIEVHIVFEEAAD